jgi:hypothetical protein
VISPGTCTRRNTAGRTSRSSILSSKIFVFAVTQPADMPRCCHHRYLSPSDDTQLLKPRLSLIFNLGAVVVR